MRVYSLISALVTITSISACASRDLNLSRSIFSPAPAGLVNVGLPGAFCTGVQIDERRALTAAHCLYNKDGSGVVNAKSIHVVREADIAPVNNQVLSSEMLPGFEIGLRTVENINYDVAVLTFSDAVPGNFPTLNISDGPMQLGERVVTSYYKNVGSNFYLVEANCSVLNRKKSVLVLDCPIDFGASGAPVYRVMREGASALVAIIVAKAMWRNRPVALAVNVGSV
ncbi:trypsin-like peptidase domain-containing protein [Phaeobacter gallaeciensis]|uniref:trypsin-like serine peptidase n=1 Tax=Rhodobacterales TaxID=204455 RepID=UPI00237F477C|nr:trypsin-like peptidase domain-containing protein [Phaeobacter gallaeciensis]MDE4201817.1 trypsin-like peptidase domain-containing protein [Phaeobacter gallaeciensis]MDE4210122.1 trypsin-like peptidase domain-containing protein [Phaeobacter gallaeciensis]MDE4218487.1 trypsin-like peptidase domain-containing protein [Phaeobacter gallaeciensis]MDE4222634.1 trypsin-like peptidase domain-containing protein [Phaeobacter gallaeciensis]MDE4226776.1 trypsin-like peptidase domain-containing protein [